MAPAVEAEEKKSEGEKSPSSPPPPPPPSPNDNGRNGGESGGRSAAMDARSVLARAYVPARYRSVNEAAATARFYAAPVHRDGDAAAAARGRRGEPTTGLVPVEPVCSCARGAHSGGREPHRFPRRNLQPGLHYAIEHRSNQSTGSSASSSPLQRQQQQVPTGAVVGPLPAVNGASDLDGYCRAFERLLHAERSEVLLRYEQYSQYDKPLVIMWPRGKEAFLSSNGGGAWRARALIPGIADAKPSLRPGDAALVRPVEKLSLPLAGQPLGNPYTVRWSHPWHTVEITASVLAVHRHHAPGDHGSSSGSSAALLEDAVYITWLQQHEAAMLQHSMELSARQNPHIPAAAKGLNRGGRINKKAFAGSMRKPVQFNLRFVPSQKHYERCLTALDWIRTLQPPALAVSLLFPTVAPRVGGGAAAAAAKVKLDESCDRLNDQQIGFVRMVVRRTLHPATDAVRGPMVLTGPAGTGKTGTMLSAVHTVLAMDPSFRCLVCAPSHTAADVVTRRLGRRLTRQQLFRCLDSDRPVETVPVDVLTFCRQSEQTGRFALPAAKELMQFRVIVCTCTDAHLLYAVGFTNQQLRLKRRCFQNYMGKCCSDVNLTFDLKGVDVPHFTHLFIDEAAQATEPESLIPLSVVVDPEPGNRKAEMALVGDPRQLHPAVYSTRAAAAGLERSWMERLLQRPVSCLGGGQEHMLGPDMVGMEEWLKYSFRHEGNEQLSVFLTLNYRGHPSFLMMPSVLFYFDKLRSVDHGKHSEHNETYWCDKLRSIEKLSKPVRVLPRKGLVTPEEVRFRKQTTWPIHFREVVGQDKSVTTTSTGFAINSWQNLDEAEVVVTIVVTLAQHGVSTQSIGVMAPFRGQVVLIRNKLRHIGLAAINVGSCEDYQAVERDVIILSCTRSSRDFIEHDMQHRMGVFGQPKRANVAMTRAEHLFIVVGNPTVMAEDPVWRQFLLYCLRNGLCYRAKTEDDDPFFEWSSATRLVRRLPNHGEDGNWPSPAGGNKGQTANEPADDHKKIIAVGTLERLLR